MGRGKEGGREREGGREAETSSLFSTILKAQCHFRVITRLKPFCGAERQQLQHWHYYGSFDFPVETNLMIITFNTCHVQLKLNAAQTF